MRKILFRGKQEGNGEWVYGYLVKLPSAIMIGDYTHPWFIYVPPKDPEDNGGHYRVIPDTVGQYTGLTDKNGTKIFEGDIVEFPWNLGKAQDKVLFRDGGFTLSHFWWSIVVDGEAAVIGNIYDTPELLGVKE